ncbi:uncharacterized protein N7511_006006 [Penicillium nucicola]|uniref:uncharacterized protein n=1 Tax=Penicillium nucicola TaxID=1850975 RepID=UPI0025453281|nr:uncharacterized protein N7511_006006 [Penicillium nucicola]KAJ5757312.1 hypothetical protein N7511_006006 [Penicillium nucicola]
MSAINLIFGGANLGNLPSLNTPENLKEVFSVLTSHGIVGIDSAQLYGESETLLGATQAGERFILDTKWMGGVQPGWATRENMVHSAKECIRKLGVKRVDVFYIHFPDAQTPIAETLAGVEEVYRLGLFQRFGLSNYQADDVQKIFHHCKEKGYVLPTVFQGNYSAVARRSETALFPTLRELGIAFRAYSPLAGGFLTKTPQQIMAGAGRFNDDTYGGMYKQMFVKPVYLEALKKWNTVAKVEGCSSAELGYRWAVYHSPLKKELGDGVLVGASSLGQLKLTLEGIAHGKLSDEAVKAIDEIWAGVKHDAP